jgi:hypothetical protein
MAAGLYAANVLYNLLRTLYLMPELVPARSGGRHLAFSRGSEL